MQINDVVSAWKSGNAFGTWSSVIGYWEKKNIMHSIKLVALCGIRDALTFAYNFQFNLKSYSFVNIDNNESNWNMHDQNVEKR